MCAADKCALLQVTLEEELSTDFRALAPERPVYEARRMRAVSKQAPGAAEADLRAMLAELRWALGGLASSQLPRKQPAGATAQQPVPQQQQPANEEGAQEAELQTQDPLPGQPEGGEPDAADAEGDAVSRAAEDTTHLAYLLLGQPLGSPLPTRSINGLQDDIAG